MIPKLINLMLIRSRHDRARIHNWTFANEMLAPICREHPEWFAPAPPEQYGMMTAPRDQLVFLRGGQTADWLGRHPRRARSTKTPQSRTPSDAAPGPGDYLHDAILRWVGESPTEDCQCRSRIAQMNAWGPQGCRKHLEEIVDWLLDEAKRRGWWIVTPRRPLDRQMVGAWGNRQGRRVIAGRRPKRVVIAMRHVSELPRCVARRFF